MAALYTIGRDPYTGAVSFGLVADANGAQFIGLNKKSTETLNKHIETVQNFSDQDLPETAIDWLSLALTNLAVATNEPLRALSMKDGLKKAKVALDHGDSERRPETIRARLAAEAAALDDLYEIWPDLDEANLTPEQELERSIILAGGINTDEAHRFYPEDVGADTCAFCELTDTDPIHDEAA